jgi:uncharacterized phage protein (TIGR02218 family)
MITHIGQEVTTLATLWKIKRVDGTLFGFTDHDRDIPFDDATGDGLITYAAATGYTRTAIKNTSNLSVANLDLDSFFDSSAIDEADLRAGLWDKADVRIMLINYLNTSDGIIKMRRGTLGDVTILDDMYTAELRGMTQALQQTIGELYTPDCREDLGSPKCGVRLDPPVWTADTPMTQRLPSDAKTGSVVKPVAFNDRHFKAAGDGTSADVEPSWNLTLGGTTVSGSKASGTILFNSNPAPSDTLTLNGVTWTFVAGAPTGNETQIQGDTDATVVQLASDLNASADVDIDDATYSHPVLDTLTIIHDVLGPAGNAFGLVASGDATVSAATLLGGTDLDWTTIQALTIEATVDVVTDRRQFTLTYAGDAPDALLTGGLITFLSGPNIGLSVEVKDWTLSTNRIDAFLPLPFTVSNGETVTVSAGCDKTAAVCIATFDNIHNLRGEPLVPGVDALLRFPDARQ